MSDINAMFRTKDGITWEELRGTESPDTRTVARQQAVEEIVAETFRPRIFVSPNTSGIVAAMTEHTLEFARDRSPKYWTNTQYYFPPPSTFVFVSEEMDTDTKWRIGSYLRAYKIAGTMNDLNEIIMLYDMERVVDEKIFVPFVDERLLTYVAQQSALNDVFDTDLFHGLVANQFPEPYRSRLLTL